MVSNGKLMAFINALGGGSSGPSEVVILPETELTVQNIHEDGGQYMLAIAPETSLVDGGVYKIMWGGVEYNSQAIDASSVMGAPAGTAFVLGNTDIFEMTEVVGGNPAPDLPFFLLIIPAGESDEVDDSVMYGQMISLGITPEPPVLSIVQTEGAASGGSAGGESMVFTTMATRASDGTVTLDKSYDDLVAAYKAGKLVKAMIVNGGMTLTLPAVSLNQDSGNDNLYFSLYMKISSSMSMWASLAYDNKNGTITYDGGY